MVAKAKRQEGKKVKARALPPPNLMRGDLHLEVTGFKAVGESTSVKIAPLTILAGSNSAGKSSFMQPFLLLKQTIDSSFDPGPILLHGPNAKFTAMTQTLSRGKSRSSQADTFSVALSIGSHRRAITFRMSNDGFNIVEDISSDGVHKVSLNERMSNASLEGLSPYFNSIGLHYREVSTAQDSKGEYKLAIERNRCFLDLGLTFGIPGDRRMSLSVPLIDRHTEVWSNLIRGIIHVPGLRGNPEREYPRSAVGDTYIGRFDTYVASIILEWSGRSPEKVRTLARNLELLGLTWKIRARKVNDAAVELLVGRTPHAQQGGALDLVSVADVGFGVSQALPVLVALLAASRGQVVYLEQPELHLHPRAQLSLAQPLVAAARRGVRVVLETHSSLLIRALQTAIASGSIPASSVSMNWFSRDPETGFANLSVAELDDKGRFGEWPLDFDEIAQDADLAYLDAIRGSKI
ncbi:AAA family ATPase [Cellulosimicrobium cellulans]|uniref:AAA family ATPase n=1 Tax=Cellulosimicrobium cellulans TaxID=1710 RepID=UPI0036E88C2F